MFGIAKVQSVLAAHIYMYKEIIFKCTEVGILASQGVEEEKNGGATLLGLSILPDK